MSAFKLTRNTPRRTGAARSWVFALSLMLLVPVSLPALAQGVLGGSQTGVIQAGQGLELNELLISGVIYEYDIDSTEFTLRGEEISFSDLEIGMVVRFTVDNGILETVQILGPNNLIEDFDSH